MPKTTEQKFQLHANFWFEISIQDLRDLFCTMGQGSGYWAHSVTVGDIQEDEEGYYLPNQDYEHEGCCAWVKDLTLDTKISKFHLKDHQVGIIDTVGFINNIPTQLIESFHATLEEITSANFIINVVDVNDINHNVRTQKYTTLI